MNLPKIIANARNKTGSAGRARTSQAKGLSPSSSPNAPVAFDAAVLYLLCRLGSWPGLSAKDLQTARQALLTAKLDKTATQLKALAALRDLAVGGSTVFAVADATGPLTATLGKAKGELKAAIESRQPDVKFGLYYSLFEWFHPLYLQDKANNFTTRSNF